MPICKLCQKDKKLIKAHIIPSFMYKELQDENQNIKLIEDVESLKSFNRQTGEFDKDILCQKCDNNIIGQYEDYTRKILYGGIFYNQQVPKVYNAQNKHGLKWKLIINVDYKKFKLFLLSLIWRASVTNRDFFEEIDLEEHEDIIRQMILNGDPGDPKDYPCIMFTYRFNVPELSQVVINPNKIEKNGQINFKFLIGGIFYLFYIQYKKLDKFVKFGMLDKSNELRILHTPKKSIKDILINYLGFKI